MDNCNEVIENHEINSFILAEMHDADEAGKEEIIVDG